MRLNEPRITPLSDAEANEAQAAALASFVERKTDYNIFRTMARHPRALDRFLKWGNYILSRENTLSARTRELAILRVGCNCVAGYEWAQHAVIGRRAGLTEDELTRIKAGPAAGGWSEEDRAVLAACDDLTGDFFISDATWAALARHLSQEQCMDLVFTVGQYTQVSMLLNSFGVQPDAGLVVDPDLDRRARWSRLAGKAAVVIGAGQTPGDTIGNGRATALLFAREGARVFCVDRHLDRAEETVAMITQAGGQAFAYAADIRDDAACAELVGTARDRLGAIDILHNNVGGGAGDAPVETSDPARFEAILRLNLTAMMQTIRHVLPVMRDQGGGAIVNISSLASIAPAGIIAYEVSKAGANKLTTSVAALHARDRIRCNAILPGLIDTPMAIGGWSAMTGDDQAKLRAKRDARVPLGRMGTAWDVAHAALWLASDDARFVTGVLLPVDGGQSVRVG